MTSLERARHGVQDAAVHVDLCQPAGGRPQVSRGVGGVVRWPPLWAGDGGGRRRIRSCGRAASAPRRRAWASTAGRVRAPDGGTTLPHGQWGMGSFKQHSSLPRSRGFYPYTEAECCEECYQTEGCTSVTVYEKADGTRHCQGKHGPERGGAGGTSHRRCHLRRPGAAVVQQRRVMMKPPPPPSAPPSPPSAPSPPSQPPPSSARRRRRRRRRRRPARRGRSRRRAPALPAVGAALSALCRHHLSVAVHSVWLHLYDGPHHLPAHRLARRVPGRRCARRAQHRLRPPRLAGGRDVRCDQLQPTAKTGGTITTLLPTSTMANTRASATQSARSTIAPAATACT